MTNEQQPDPLRIAALLEKTGAQGSLRDEAASELLRQHAELETLRTGYAAARLEIESLKAQLAAQQPGVAYAALPEPITYQIAVLKACEHGDALVGWRVEPSRQSFDASMRPKRKLYTEGNMHDFADATHALRASHGQAPAGDWLWVKLMDFCKKRGFAPANFNDLFEIVDAARAARDPADSLQEDVPESEYRRGYRHGYEQRDAEVRGALV